MHEVVMNNLNGIIETKRKISKEIDIDAVYITDVFIDGTEVVFTIMQNEKFVADWKNGDIVAGSTQHIKTYPPMEEVEF